MAETAEVNIGLKKLSHPHEKAEFIQCGRHAKNAAVPGQSCPNLTVFSYVLPLKNSGNKRKGDEAKHDRG